MTCLADSQILRFIEQSLSSEESTAVEEHVDVCTTCRRLLLHVAKGLSTRTPKATMSSSPSGHGTSQWVSEPASQDSDGKDTTALPTVGTGTLIDGRYMVLEMIGMGGMGRVYAAYDRQLDRKVALKLLRNEQDNAHKRLLHEAKALAKLSHPNVVGVHDIGRAFGQTYMAMEYVEGRTLKSWLLENRRDTQNILEVFLDAAKGLSAAHRAGLVHRDFKADNVLIGKDGRVRVTDFGLARPLRFPDVAINDTVQLSREERLVEGLTVSTRLEGTPLYIAPERFAGKPSDARGDQFAFCVSLYEALYGEYPFRFGSLAELPRVLAQGRVRPASKGSRVPNFVRVALLKGLAADPALRFENMETMMTALRGTKGRTRVLQLAIVCLLVGLGTAGVSHAFTRREEKQSAVCQGSERMLEGVWDDTEKNAVKNAIMASKMPYAESTWKSVQESMDRHATQWVAAHRDACLATRVYGDQSEEVLDRRTACLNLQLVQFRALSRALTEVRGDGVARSAEAPEQLGDPALCQSIEVIRDHMLPYRNEEMHLQVDALRARAAKVKALYDIGQREEIIDEVLAIGKESDALKYPPLEAEVGLLMATALQGKKSTDELRKILENALLAAESGRHERAALQLWLKLASFSIWIDTRSTDAEMYLKHAEAYLQRIEGKVERHDLLRHRSALYRGQFRAEEALHVAEEAVTHAENAFGADSIQVSEALRELGINLHLSKQFERSRTTMRRSIKIAERNLGEHHPTVAVLLLNYGQILIEQDERHSEEYIEAFRRASLIAKGTKDPRLHAHVATVLAAAMNNAKQYNDALRLLDDAGAITERLLPPFHTNRVEEQSERGVALLGLGQDAQACEAFLEAMDIAEKGPGFDRIVPTIMSRAEPRLAACTKNICKDTLKNMQSRAKKNEGNRNGGMHP